MTRDDAPAPEPDSDARSEADSDSDEAGAPPAVQRYRRRRDAVLARLHVPADQPDATDAGPIPGAPSIGDEPPP